MRGLAFAAGGLVLFLILDFTLESIIPDSSVRQLLMLAGCNILVALSLNVINGMAGQFSIGHAGFVGIGAYTGAIVAGNIHVALGSGDPTFAHSFIVMPAVLAFSGQVITGLVEFSGPVRSRLVA